MPRHRRDTRRCLWVAILAGLNTVLGGCVAMNIPSVRYDDPSDRGGLLGPQRPANAQDLANRDEIAGCGETACGNEASSDKEQEPPPPQVPWPRFHPLPTRPVFSPSLSDSL